MNWNKKPINFLITLVCVIFLCTTPHITYTQTPPPGMPADFNFEDFMKNLEQALKEVEEEEATKDEDKTTPEPAENMTPSLKEPTEVPIKTAAPIKEIAQAPETVQEKQPTKTDPESLFVEPGTQTITDPIKKTKKTEPTQQSVKAFHTIINEFIDHVESIEKKVMDSSRFSLEFEEQFIPLLENTDLVIVSLRQIASKKAYIHLFITPPDTNKKLVADFKKIRKQIIEISHRLKKIDTSLVIKAEKEIIREEEELQETLKEMAAESQKDTTPPAPTPKKQEFKPVPRPQPGTSIPSRLRNSTVTQ